MPDFPKDPRGGENTHEESAEDVEDLRDRMLELAGRGKIKSTERFLKRATMKQLERIKCDYEHHQTEIVDELVSKYLIGGMAKLMKSMEYLNDFECEEMKETLMSNDLVKRDLGDLSGYITRNIRYIGIATIAVVAGGYVISKRYGQQTEPTEPSGNFKPPGWQSHQDDPAEGRQDGE